MLLALGGCAKPLAPVVTQLPPELPPVIQAFADICIKAAPDFAAAAKAAEAYSIQSKADAAGVLTGTSMDKTLNLQIKPGKECVISTIKQPNTDLTQKFLRSVSYFTNERVPHTLPAKIMVNKELFIFHHDRKNAETFVMMKAKG
ncbi:MAG: hypothetical protein Q4G39_07090 [Brachymonas sp.]|nr:hypothetical protein [Brachymonas sp.]